MPFFTCEIPNCGVIGIATRIQDGQPQTLVACRGVGLRMLRGAHDLGEIELGDSINLQEESLSGELPPGRTSSYNLQSFDITSPTWDDWSASIYAFHGNTIIRVVDNRVSRLAGNIGDSAHRDGVGLEARFHAPIWLTSNGAGALYCVDGITLRRIQLPRAFKSGSVRITTPAGGMRETAVVNTLMAFPALPGGIQGFTYLSGTPGCSGSLAYATRTALYRLPLDAGGSLNPIVLSGKEGDARAEGNPGEGARFVHICGLAADAEGHLVCCDIVHPGLSLVRRVAPDGEAVNLIGLFSGMLQTASILPNGSLALRRHDPSGLLFLLLGLQPAPLQLLSGSAETSSDLARRSLASDLAAVLEQPGETADVILVTEGRSFPVHRIILAARCDYFKQRLAKDSGFPDGCMPELCLPDADPDALAVLLRFLYTDAVAIPQQLACQVAELADRLLLPELAAAACEQVRMQVSPETAVESVLWAERCAVRGGGFPQLLGELKRWLLDNYDVVTIEAGDSLQRLGLSPSLTLELLRAAMERATKRPRAGGLMYL